MLKFALCDDNKVVLSQLEKILESIFINYNIEAEISLSATSPHEVLYHLASHHIDILISDINFGPGSINGCDLAELVRKKNNDIYLIFNSAHLEHSANTHKYRTFDFIAKPMIPEKIENLILRLSDEINTKESCPKGNRKKRGNLKSLLTRNINNKILLEAS